MSTNGIGSSYEDFLQSIKSRGLKTTSLGNGEANFADYANALSSGLKEELLQSIGDEAGDAQLQSKVAGLFGGKSVMQSNEIINAAKAAGLNVSVEYVSTSYIIDNKQDGHYDKDVTNGAIAVYTFSDGNSTIKIADANGNGALEAEEIYLNEILGDVTNSLGASATGASNGTSAIDFAKKQQEILMSQIQASMESQQEIMKQMEELRNSFANEEVDNNDKTTKNPTGTTQSEEKMSQKDFEQKVLNEALSLYKNTSLASVEVIENAIKSINSENGTDFSLSAQEIVELADEYKHSIEEEKKKDETQEPKLNDKNFFEGEL